MATASVLLAVVSVLHPVLHAPTETLLGSPRSEGPGHFWGLWVAAEGLWTHGPFVRVTDRVTAPTGFRSDMADPLHSVAFWVFWTLGGRGVSAGAFAWNMLYASTVGLAGLGGWKLARCFLPAGPGALVAATACAASPYLLQSDLLGRTEYLAGAWYPLHLAFLYRHLGPDGRRMDTVLAVVTLVALTMAGWCQATWIAMVEIPLALLFSRRMPSVRSQVVGILQVALPALLVGAVGIRAALAESPEWAMDQWSTRIRGVPLTLGFFFPWLFEKGLTVGAVEIPPYPGLVLLVVASLAVVRVPRKAGPWLGLAAVLLCFAMGPTIALGLDDTAATIAGPAAWASELPVLGRVSSWYRLAVFLGMPLGMAAAWGVHHWSRTAPRLAAAACLVIVPG
ncbi:MAG: hypothetical protein QGG40_17455, partial [Myxococcota bacterium]|nr:hypothetical protein [Myxococcota bacterium]